MSNFLKIRVNSLHRIKSADEYSENDPPSYINEDYKILKVLESTRESKIVLVKSYKYSKNIIIKLEPTKKLYMATTPEKYKNIRFKTEVSALKKLNNICTDKEIISEQTHGHPNIIKILESTINIMRFNKKYNEIQLEYASKGDLFTFLKKIESDGKFLTEMELKNIIKQILDALKYAYDNHNISHRDIKLENIFMKKDETIIVGDWGFAAFNVKNKKLIRSCGTLNYMAPEILRRESYDSNKTDIWAVAVLMFSLITQLAPYGNVRRKKNIKDNGWYDEWLSSILKKKWNIWWLSHERSEILDRGTNIIKSFTPEFKNLIENMMNPDAEKRYSIDQTLNDPWFN